jgi:lysophospholipase L1-like esterase
MRRLLAAVLLLFARPAFADQAIAFGDSWAEQGADELQAALRAGGYPALLVDERALGGTTTQYWVTTQPMELVYAVDANPDARWIWLSLGGNDSTQGRADGMTPQQIAAQIDTNIRTLLDTLFAAHPHVQVVMFGYDYTNWTILDCPAERDALFGAGSNQATVNQAIMTEVGAVQSQIAQDYPNAAYVPIWGAMQIAGGLNADPTQPSPANLMTDCVHPNTNGYRAVFDALVDAWWNVPAPTAVITDDGTERCTGNSISFDSVASTNVEHLRWTIDGVEAGRSPTLMVPLANAGTIEVGLTVYNSALSASSTQEIVVDPCLPDAGVPDAAEPDAGIPDSGDMDVGPRDAITPPDTGGLKYDGGLRDDAGNLIPEDGGVTIRDGGPGWTLGGGCSAAGRATEGSVWPLLLALCVALARCSARRPRL